VNRRSPIMGRARIVALVLATAIATGGCAAARGGPDSIQPASSPTTVAPATPHTGGTLSPATVQSAEQYVASETARAQRAEQETTTTETPAARFYWRFVRPDQFVFTCAPPTTSP